MISKDMQLLELMQRYPKAKKYLESQNMNCGSCMGAVDETIAMAAKQHGMDLNLLLKELNQLVGDNEDNGD
ncbi:MAG: DUF1858 domain-containing protein [Clostridia bacterium]|nr:DUF1858 domain-containing protein [Clostridia bacterium]